MAIEGPTHAAVALLKSLIHNPRLILYSPLLRLLVADRMVMGFPAKVHITQQDGRLLAQYEPRGLN